MAGVAVEENDEIAQDSSSMLVHSQGTFCWVAHFRISTTAPAVGLSRVPQKTTKTTLYIMWYHMLVSCCTNPKRKENTTTRTRTCSCSKKKLFGYTTGKIKSNPLEPHFETSATMSQSLDGTKTAVALPHYSCSENTKIAHRRVVHFRIRGVMSE